MFVVEPLRPPAQTEPTINWNSEKIADEIGRQNRGIGGTVFDSSHHREEHLSVGGAGKKASKVFPAWADIRAIQQHRLQSREQIRSYAIDQELTAVDEHGARSRITKLTGHMTKDGRVVIGGMDIRELAEKSLAQNPTDLRLRGELNSIIKLIESIHSDPTGSHLVFSPAKLNFGEQQLSYGLTFLFEPGDLDADGNRQITQKIISYAEKYGFNDASKEYLKKILESQGGVGPDIQSIDSLSTEDLLTKPFHLKKQEGDTYWAKLFQISPAEQELSRQFKTELYRRRVDDLNRYAELLYEYKDLKFIDSASLNEFTSEADMLKDKLFGYGVQLAKAMRSGDFTTLDEYDESETVFIQRQTANLSTSMTLAQRSALAYFHQIGQFGQPLVESTQCPTAYLQNAVSQAGGSVYGAFGLLAGGTFGIARSESNKKTSIWVSQLRKYVTVDYSFDKRNECVMCKRTASVGPCNICMHCTANIIAKEHQGHQS